MALDPAVFSTLTPSQYISFIIPNFVQNQNQNQNQNHHLNSPFLRVSVLDSPIEPPISTTTCPQIAAMIVPFLRESDWIFSTFSGHLQLLLPNSTSRLVLISNHPPPSSATSSPPLPPGPDLQQLLMPLLISLSPISHLSHSPEADLPFFTYHDGVISRVVLQLCIGPRVGHMLVEDVEIRDEFGSEFRRRLRFKRTPNLVQTQIRIAPDCGNDFLNVGILVQPYLVPMVASLSLVGLRLDEKIRRGGGFRPKALCLGVGGGALLSFLNTRLGFEVVGVEEDEAVLGVARRWFGLPDDTYVRVCIGDGMEFVKKLASAEKGGFDVVMVDLDSSEVGVGSMAPPMEFVEESVLFATRAVLCEGGIVVVNVIPASRLLYERLVGDFRKVFDEMYEIDVGNGENFVLIGSRKAIGIYSRDSESGFHRKLREAISGEYMESIKKI